MTSRLKHKLELDNVNLKSAYLNESFVQIGTPLPALSDTKKDKLDYVPVWQQEVRDEKGRQRFHGAFTGGFSAGYYNTVGSKEGWTPSTFKSSRTNRANNVQRAEDFMDEEDLQQMNEDRKLERTEMFKTDTFRGTKDELGEKSLPSVLESLIAPAQTSIGQTLLKKLGWKPGQGIGPRVSLRKHLAQQRKLGLADDGEDEPMDEGVVGKGKSFAPRDTRLLVYEGKEDREGLGYEKGKGMGRLPAKAGPSYGAEYANVGEEDDDPYSVAGPSNSGLAFAFDSNKADEDDDDVIVMGGPSRPQSRSKSTKQAREAHEDRWHDGRPMLPGFVLDPLGVPTDKWFALPDIPPDWRPRPARVWGTVKKWDEEPGIKVEEKEFIRGAPGRPLTFEQRGDALGEARRIPESAPPSSAPPPAAATSSTLTSEPAPSAAKSVFEYMTEKQRERLVSRVAAAGQAPPPPLLLSIADADAEDDTQPKGPGAESEEVVIPPLSPRTASAALRGYAPYKDDAARQERYESYLRSQTYNTKEPNPTLKPHATIEGINKELEDFHASARIFKPMSFAMSSRFTSGSASLATSDLKQAKPGLHIFDAAKAKAEAENRASSLAISEAQQPKKALTAREQAAESGMYGRLTREVREFYPVKLLCKRFGVGDPHPEGAAPGSRGTARAGTNEDDGGNSALDSMPLPKNDASWESAFIHQSDNADANANTNGASGKDAVVPVPAQENEERAPRTLAEVGMAEDVNQGRDTLTYTKPSIDIFKAIFASDDEDDSDGDEEEDNSKGKKDSTMPSASASASALPVPVQVKSEPALEKVAMEKPLVVEDLATFKPVFRRVQEEETIIGPARPEPTTDFTSNGNGGGGGATVKKKKKSKRKGVLSFDMGEGDEDEGDAAARREEKRRRRRQEEAGEWVEKVEEVSIPSGGGRKGAADFM